jgi:hypothetical protein
MCFKVPACKATSRVLNGQKIAKGYPNSFKEFGLDEDNLSEIEDMVSACAGLVTINKESGDYSISPLHNTGILRANTKAMFP